MNIVNVMNFVRTNEPRDIEVEKKLLRTTEMEIELVKSYGFENTFLLEYDALCDSRFTKLFLRERDDKMEIGLWYEIVKPLTDKVGLEWRGHEGWDWDWHVIPGFSMAYTPEERIKLIDEAMRKFKETFGHYPKTVASWLIDSVTVNYLSENYDIDAFMICRDQINTDAYTLVGGYFNQAYYPSKKNMFCPAQTKENMNKIPVFRLLGPCPIYNSLGNGCYTLEPVWEIGSTPEDVEWMFKTYIENENMGFSYMQLGQENSFSYEKIIEPLRMQLDKIAARSDVAVMKVSDSGKWFKEHYDMTPPTSVVAEDNWRKEENLQSACYDCKNYAANLFFDSGTVGIRTLYMFDENFSERYLDVACDTLDAVYENLPLSDSILWKGCGLYIDGVSDKFHCFAKEGALVADMGGKTVSFYEDKIVFEGCTLTYRLNSAPIDINLSGNTFKYVYRGFEYAIDVKGNIEKTEDGYKISENGGEIVLKIR